MNILIMADYRTPKSGNFIASLLELANFLKKENSTAIFVFPSKNESGGGYLWTEWLQNQGYRVILLDDNDENLFEVLNNIIRKNYIDIIHSHFGYKHKFLIKEHQKFGNIKLVFHDHMDFSENISVRRQKISVMRRALFYRIFNAYVISVMKKKDRAYWLAGKKRHFYVPNGLSLHRAEKDTRTREEIREELGLKPNEKFALFLGWDLHRKGLDIAIKGIEKYRRKYPNLKLGVIGAGHCKPSKNTVQFLKEAGCDPYAEWILYLNDWEDIFALNRAIDVYISASRAEAFSYGILESISQNNPVVVSNIEGTSWSWEYNKCVVFRNEDTDSCALAIENALSLGKSESNYKDIVAKYSIEKWCKRIMNIYEKIIM